MTVTLTRCCNDFSSRRISSRSCASRLLSGSSSSKTFGEKTERARQRHALLLAAAQRRRRTLFQAGEPDSPSTSATFFSASRPSDAAQLQRISDVLEHRHVRPQA